MALTVPYLHFMGNCAEALAFYARSSALALPI